MSLESDLKKERERVKFSQAFALMLLEKRVYKNLPWRGRWKIYLADWILNRLLKK